LTNGGLIGGSMASGGFTSDGFTSSGGLGAGSLTTIFGWAQQAIKKMSSKINTLAKIR
jgi:hypothetical protein